MDAQSPPSTAPPRQSRLIDATQERRGIAGRLRLPTDPAWWGGPGFLRLHVSLFLAAIPALFLVNLILSPDRLWVGRAGLAWLALLVVHAAIVGMLWAIRLLGQDSATSDRSPAPTPDSGWAPAHPPASWGTVSRPGSGIGGHAPDASTGPGSMAPPPASASGRVWDGWTAPVRPSSFRPGASPSPGQAAFTPTTPSPGPAEPVAEERVSWRTVAQAAWLAPPDDEPPSAPPADHP